MEVSGEAADLVVKEGLQAAEAAVKLAEKGAVSAAALLAALAKDNYKVIGKTNVKRLAKDSARAVVVPVKREDVKQFARLAKRYGVLYTAVRKRGSDSPVIDVISNVNYAAQLNAVLETMGYPIPEKRQEEQPAKKAQPLRPLQEKSSPERGSGLNPKMATTPDKPSVRGRLATLEAAARELNRNSPSRRRDKTL